MEMLDRVGWVLRKQAALFTVLGFAAALAALGARVLMEAEVRPPEAAPRTVFFYLLLVSLRQLPLGAALALGYQTLLMPRRPITLGAIMLSGLRRWPHLVLTYGLMLAAALCLVGVVQEVSKGGSLGAGGALLAAAATLAGFWVGIAWALAPACAVLEGRLPFEAVARSMKMMVTPFAPARVRQVGVGSVDAANAADGPRQQSAAPAPAWPAFDTAPARLLLLALLAAAAVAMAESPVPLAMFLVTGVGPLSTAAERLAIPRFVEFWEPLDWYFSFLGSWALGPAVAVAMATLYVELRIRREGLDLALRLMARESDAGTAPPGEVAREMDGGDTSGLANAD